MKSPATRQIGGFDISDVTADDLAAEIDRRIAMRQKTLLFFVNSNFVVKCQALREHMAAAPVIAVNDGLGMKLASLAVHGRRFAANMNGTDFIPFYLGRGTGPIRVFLLGSREEDLAGASAALAAMEGIEVAGVQDGFSFRQKGDALMAEINASRADIVLVGMGNPLQEAWILANHQALDAPLIAGVGALFVWLSGRRKRAPVIVQRLSMEWAYRLLIEPRRLAGRYTLGTARFTMLAFAHRPRRIGAAGEARDPAR
jgi:beta-1,4-glucosyltransferase